jgi:hypothetical protein
MLFQEKQSQQAVLEAQMGEYCVVLRRNMRIRNRRARALLEKPVALGGAINRYYDKPLQTVTVILVTGYEQEDKSGEDFREDDGGMLDNYSDDEYLNTLLILFL